jgi:hypothetical protein
MKKSSFDPPEPPSGLSEKACGLWRAVTRDYVLEHHHQELLRKALEQLDLADQAHQLVVEAGPVVKNRFGEDRPHIGIEISAGALRLHKSLMREINLDGQIPDEGYRRAPILTTGRAPKGTAHA